MRIFVIISVFVFLSSCSDKINYNKNVNSNDLGITRIYEQDSNSFEEGKVKEGFKFGLWVKCFLNDTARVEKCFYGDYGKLLWTKRYSHNTLSQEFQYLSDGELDITYYRNIGLIYQYGYRSYGDGEYKGLWKTYSDEGKLKEETFYNYPETYISRKIYDKHGLLDIEKEFYSPRSEGEEIPNGVWKYYLDGKVVKIEKYKMGQIIK